MHIVLGILGSLITILILLSRLADAGIDFRGLNPFLWRRRRRWRKQYEGNPAFKLSDPMEATALLMVAVAKCDGDLAREQKTHLLELFEREFHLSPKDAQSLLISSSHLHGDGEEVRAKVREVLAPSLERFTPEQADSALGLLQRVAAAETTSCAERDTLLAVITRELAAKPQSQRAWAPEQR